MLWRRRRSPPPVVLPSLDRLAGLIERVVELVDAVAVAPGPEPEAVQAPASPSTGWVAFVASPAGYRIVDREGSPPSSGEGVELEGGRYRVLRLGPSPLPGDRRRCVFVEREEPPEAERTFDA